MSDQYYDKVVLLMPMNGIDGGDTFTEYASNPNTITAAGGTHTETDHFKYYDSSGYFNGSSNLTFPNSRAFAFGAGAFTIEFWVYAVLNDDKFFLGGRAAIGTMHITTGGAASSTTTGALRYVGSSSISSGSIVVTDSAWHHCAITRDNSNNITLWVDGVSRGTGTDTTNYATTTGTWYVGQNDSGAASYLTGYIQDLRITKGYARYTTTFTPPAKLIGTISGTIKDGTDTLAARTVRIYPRLTGLPMTQIQTYIILGDPYWESVVLGMHMDGLDDGTTFTDVKGKTVTPSGGAVTKTATKKFGTASAYFNGSTAVCTIPYSADFTFVGVNWTIEFFVYRFAGYGGTPISRRNAGVYAPYEITIGGTGTVSMLISGSGDASWAYGPSFSGVSVPADTWSHIAIVGSGNNITCYVNGLGSSPVVASIQSSGTQSMYIGRGGDYMFNGYLDDLRITKGVARYTSAFVPPANAFYDTYGGPTDDGSFSITVPDTEHIVIVLDDDSGNIYNDQCSRVLPV